MDGSTKKSVYNSAANWTYFGHNITTGGSHTLRWQYEKSAGGAADETGAWVDRVEWIPSGSSPAPSLAESLDTTLTVSTGGDNNWYSQTMAITAYYDGDAPESGGIDNDQQTWMQTTYTASAGDIVSFYWKVSSESSSDFLRFEIDGTPQNSISGTNGDWQKKSYGLSAGSRTLKWVYEKDSSGSDGDDCGWVDGLYVGPSSGSLPPDPEGPGAYAESVDSSLKFTSSGDSTWSNVAGSSWDYYVDGDSAMSGSTSSGQESCLQTIVDSSSSETLKFWWKVSCQTNYDYLEFYIDGQLQTGRITGETAWAQKTYTISSGIHTLKWRYNDGGGSSGDNCGYLDFVQWTGAAPVPDSNNWQQLEFEHDVTGRRVEKKVDGFLTRYVYDGAHVIAEYDGNNNLLRKYMYGPGIDQPVCMIEVADANATYYYHFDALGSVVALSDAAGDTVQTYEYSVYGEVAVEDANHTNPYMFAGRRYDIEIGLYYNRARYYNPYTGRFLQTDPIGYEAGLNLYRYCMNNPLNLVDPSGHDPCDPCDPHGEKKSFDDWTVQPEYADDVGDPCGCLARYKKREKGFLEKAAECAGEGFSVTPLGIAITTGSAATGSALEHWFGMVHRGASTATWAAAGATGFAFSATFGACLSDVIRQDAVAKESYSRCMCLKAAGKDWARKRRCIELYSTVNIEPPGWASWVSKWFG